MKLKIIIVSTLMLACVLSASAKDTCSPQIKGYVAGLEAGATLAAIDKLQRDKAMKQIKYIKSLQNTLPDCKIIDFIPELKASKEAIKYASRKLNKTSKGIVQ
jgi:hypothetical protein